MAPRFKNWYKETVFFSLANSPTYTNVHEVPKIVKIQINQSLGLFAQNSQVLKKSIDDFRLISGQQPIVTKSRKAIAGFKIRKDLPLGLTVTLRGERMYEFWDE